MTTDDVTLEAESMIVEHNSLSRNALTWNGISLNGMSLNGISLNGISLNALSAGTLDSGSYSAITAPGPTGDLARQFMRYAVSCAFLPSQTFSFAYTDAQGITHQEAYAGELGIEPNWATGPLNDERQHLLTGCLAARVNFYETPVVISMRSWYAPLYMPSSDPEIDHYPDVEGAFWGNIFSSDPYMVSCYNSSTVNNSRAYYRDCATGHIDETGAVVSCGKIQVIGPCSSFCMFNKAGKYYTSCQRRPGVNSQMFSAVITTALP